MEDITDLFLSIIKQSDSYEMAEAEFRRTLVDEPDLRRQYREYCRENGTSEKRGFLDYCEEYMEGANEMWDSLNDYDNQE